ncbi:MAG: LanC-like protein [Gaiellaceae bacterium]
MALFDGAEHEPLSAAVWNEERVRAGIDRIVVGTRDALDPEGFWPRSVLDDYGRPAVSDRSLWIGAAGVLWALDRLGAGIGECGVYESYLAEPDVPGSLGLMNGEIGVLLVSWRLAPTPEKEDRLFELVTESLHRPDNELFDGVPGTMLAALHLHESTRQERWRELWRTCADTMWKQFRPDPELGCRIWIQYRRGRLIRSIGAGHGFASNAHSLLRGQALLPRTAELQAAIADTATTLAMRESALINWPTAADTYWAEQFTTRIQWCHGAPGLITSLATLPHEDRTDELMRAAGDLVWEAGPLKKGAGLCHGTAGNGCAFLALHSRTGDQSWLERAQAFAMHALDQVEASQPRYSLWTGNIGVALYLRACLEGWDGMPILDRL